MYTSRLLAGLVASTLAAAFDAQAASQHDELDEVVITATPLAELRSTTAQSISVLAGDELALRLASTVGETLAGEAGVHSTFFGPGASRPVIRGLGGDRVQVLTDGLPTLDVSGLSEDHAVAIDPALADQIEIVRGPATLLYGSGASGGIVNIVTNRIHESLPDGPEGRIELRGDSALEERAVAGRLDTGAGRVALHLDAVWRETGDYAIPGYLQSRRLREQLAADGEEVEDTRGTVPNSWTETRSGGAGVTWLGDLWTLGAALSRHDTRYGIPGGHVHEHEDGDEHADEGGPYIDLVQDRIDLVLRRKLAGGAELQLDGAANDYAHTEFEAPGEPGTVYEVDGRELRVALVHSLPGGFDGTAGLQWQQVELAATGEEAFVPDSRTRTLGAFLFEQRDFGRWVLELGGRVDRQEIEGPGLPGYDDTALNLSVGSIWNVDESLSLVAQLARIERHPSSTELYADGPHAATGQYEIGNPDFDTERGLELEAGLRFSAASWEAELRAFVTRYDGFLYLAPTGLVEDELPVYEFRQQDAQFHGLEASAWWPLGESGWSLELSADAVRGRLEQGGDLPRIPPLRLGAEVAYEQGTLRAAVSLRHSFEQDRVGAGELPTDAYTLLGAELGWRPAFGGGSTLLFLRASNLLDEDARVHTSPLKDELPLPGRSLTAGFRLGFGD